MRASKREKDEVCAYVEEQAHEQVMHLEKAASELVGPARTTSGTCTALQAAGG